MTLGKTDIRNLIDSNYSNTGNYEEDNELEFQRLIEEKENQLHQATIELERLDAQLIESEQELIKVSTFCKNRAKKEQEALRDLEIEQSKLKKGISKREQLMNSIDKCMAKIGLSHAKTETGETDRNQKCISFPGIRFDGEEALIYFHKIDFSNSSFQALRVHPIFPGYKNILKIESNFPGFLQLVRDRFLKLKEQREQDKSDETSDCSILEATARP